jgi:hypothetical protein
VRPTEGYLRTYSRSRYRRFADSPLEGGGFEPSVRVRGSWLSTPHAEPIAEFAADSPLEEAGFEPSVPPESTRWQPASLRDGRTKRWPSRSGFALAGTEGQCITRPRATNDCSRRILAIRSSISE